MSNRAWVTLATNDSYGLGALVLAHSLRRVESAYPSVVLITPSVTEPMRERLRAVFAEVIIVDVLDSRDAAHLALLQRPELGITFTKIHCWSLTQYEKCVFLDADTLVVQNCDELFEREQLSAAPDVGWPDCFNSGVFVYTPSAETFSQLITFAQERGSFDGGDQGLLNSFFSDWAHGDINKHLPFLYNVTSAAFYSYLPALKHFGQNLKIIHFIGAAKPWLQHFNFESHTVDAPEHIRGLLQLWWDLFASQVHSQLDTGMSGVAGNLARVLPGGAGQREALDELTRRQGWEAGNIDYMGADSFDNIWAKISQTLSKPRSSPPKQSPPKEIAPPQPAPEQTQVQSGEVAKEPVIEQVEVAKEAAPAEAVAPQEPAAAPAEAPAPVEEAAPADVPVTVEAVAAPEAPAPVPEVPVPVEAVAPVEAAAPAVVSEPVVAVPPSEVPVTVEAVEAEIPATVEAVAEVTSAVPAEAPAATEEIKADPVKVVEQPEQKTETPVTTEAPAAAVQEPAAEAPKVVEPSSAAAAPAATPEKPAEASATDSPPLAHTPSKEEAAAPAAKSEERRKPAGKLKLVPPAAADPLPTPDSELEDAAALAQSIIASELRTPTVTPPEPAAPATPASPPPAAPAPAPQHTLGVEEPEVPTPPVGAVSLAQIGVKSSAKGKSTTAEQIESSVSEPVAAAAEAPKKKLVKKVVKKDAGAAGADAPVPPPRKKEKKPKEK
ncbi:uncharacterized protein LOC142972359 isoform X6 [Anticarsia gemmatalis]|uniref:uncharacterized protein LOC142972359 isoform X6 n=1 Tax=Anticarsia gemmatalis TaxID=129554 RepID=UPI003F75B993